MWRPNGGHRDDDDAGGAPGQDLLPAGHTGPQLAHQIHRHQRLCGIECGGQHRGHGGDKPDQDQPQNARWQHVKNEFGINLVAFLEIWIQHATGNARQNHEEENHKVQRPRQQIAPAAMVRITRTQGALHHGLAQAPEIKTRQRQADQQRRPRNGRIVQWADQTQMSRRSGVHHCRPAARLGKRGHGQNRRAAHQHERLDQFHTHHRRKSAHERVGRAENGEPPDQNRQAHLRENHLQHQGAGIQRHRQIRKHIADDRQYR